MPEFVSRPAADDGSCAAPCLAPPPAQTAQYSTQIFSLAVLLSSLFIYNQVSTCAAP